MADDNADDNIVSDDLPYEAPLGAERLYIVRLSVATDDGIAIYDLATRARSLHDAAQEGGRWCRRVFYRPAREILAIQTEESHAVQLARAAGVQVAGASDRPYTLEEIAQAEYDRDLRAQGPGAYRLVGHETFREG